MERPFDTEQVNKHQRDVLPNRLSDDGATEDQILALAPPRGRSPAERELLAKTYPPVAEIATSTSRSFQFPIRSLLLLTLAVAIGMGGRTWVPAKVFAGILALIANVVIFGFELNRVEDRHARFITIWMCVACGIAVTIALFA